MRIPKNKQFFIQRLRQLARGIRDTLWFTQNRGCYLLLPLSALYALLMYCRQLAYRWGLLPCWQSPIPLVVIGNLTVGGSGKTPLVVWLVQQLQRRSLRVGVVSRGYGGHYDGSPQLVYGDSSPQQVGDEPVLIVQRTGVPMAVAVQRSQAVKLLLQRFPLDLIISDDGLQHYSLHRNVEWLVVDGERRFGNGYRLPAGPLREGLSRMKTVDAIIVNGSDAKLGEYSMQMLLLQAVNLLSGLSIPLTALPAGGVAIAGIAHPQRFFAQLAQQGVHLQHSIAFADHQSYQASMLRPLTVADQPLLMTEKDAVKCRAFAQTNWWYCPVDAELPEADSLLKQLLNKIANGSSTNY